MNQETFKKIEINDTTMSLEFWNSEVQIKNYCEGILNHNNNDCKVTITFSGTDAFVTTKDKKNYTITLPKTELLTDENLKLKNIIARTVFLRHELAHILFTDFNLQDQITNKNRTFNFFDDARIENLYSRKYKGTYRLFRALIKNIYEHSKNKYFVDHANIEDFAMYCRVREKGIMPEIKNLALETLYSSLYKKYRYIFHNDYQVLIDGTKLIIKEFESIEQDYQDSLKAQQQEQQEQEEAETQQDTSQPEFEEENDEQEDGDETDNTDSETSNEDDDSESENEEEQQNDSDDVIADDENTQPKQDTDTQTDSQDDDEETDEVQQAVDEVFGAGDTEEESRDFEYSKLLKGVSEQKSIFSMEQYQFDPKDFREAEIVEFDKISRYIFAEEQIKVVKYNRRTGMQRQSYKYKTTVFNRPDAQVIYNSIVAQHKKTIVETINYLKLKLKIRSNDRILRHQIDGKLDQRNLKDILTNKNMPEVFYTTIKSIKTDSAFYFLVDFSSSMGKVEKKDAIVCCVILTEICKALNIPYEIGLFASSNSESFRVVSMEAANIVATILSKNKSAQIKVDSNGKRKHYVYTTNNNINLIYRLKNIKDKHTAFTEQLLANVYSYPYILSGGTPEFESVLSIIKSNANKNIRKHVFIINDGMINSAREIQQLANNTLIYNNKLRITIPEQVYKTVKSEQLVRLLFEKLKVSLINSREFFEMTNWNLRYNKNSKTIEKYSDAVYEEYLEILNSPDKYDYVLSDAKKPLPACDYYSVYLTGLFTHGWEYFSIEWTMVESVAVYQKAIEYAKKNGFDIHGFGIRSAYGIKYLGDQFQIFKDSKDIENGFAAKVRVIF